ncbi:PTS system, sugar-specific IIA component [Enterococcus sp. DIV0756]
MLGEGIAVELSGEAVRAPCDCKVIMIANTLHALGLLADNGAEILIHIGLETTQLNGKGFSVLVSPEQEVKKGEPLILLEKDFIEEKGYNLVTPMVITNSSEFSVEIIKQGSASVEKIQGPVLVVGK